MHHAQANTAVHSLTPGVVQRGTILPGANEEFCFVFKPRRAGLFTETWTLHTQPAVPTPDGPLQVTLRGCCAVDDRHQLQRRTLDTLLASEQKRRQCSAALERILLDVTEPAPHTIALPSAEQSAHDAFAASVAGVGPEGTPAFYSPKAVAALGEVFSAMRPVLCPPPDPKAKVKAPKKGEAPREPLMPESWDGRVDTLRDFTAKVRPRSVMFCALLSRWWPLLLRRWPESYVAMLVALQRRVAMYAQ